MSLPQQMRALQLTDPGVIEVRQVPVPTLAADQVLVEVGAAGLCHSDLHLLHFPYKMREEPLTLGHEIAGTVVAVGSAVTEVPVGQRSAVYLCWSCGTCRECAGGNENVCRAAGRTAMPPCPGLGPDGGMAEYVAVPARAVVAPRLLARLAPRAISLFRSRTYGSNSTWMVCRGES